MYLFTAVPEHIKYVHTMDMMIYDDDIYIQAQRRAMMDRLKRPNHKMR